MLLIYLGVKKKKTELPVLKFQNYPSERSYIALNILQQEFWNKHKTHKVQQIPDALSDFNVNLVITTSFKITYEKPIKLFLAYFYAIK